MKSVWIVIIHQIFYKIRYVLSNPQSVISDIGSFQKGNYYTEAQCEVKFEWQYFQWLLPFNQISCWPVLAINNRLSEYWLKSWSISVQLYYNYINVIAMPFWDSMCFTRRWSVGAIYIWCCTCHTWPRYVCLWYYYVTVCCPLCI